MVETLNIADIRRPNGWSPIRRELGVGSFGINAWTAAEAGDNLVGEHDETRSGHEELYVVVAGSARFTVDGEDVDAPAGTVVFVRDPASKRKAVSSEAGTTLLSVGGKVGEAYAPRAWEVNSEVFALFGNGEIEQAKQLVSEAIPEFENDSDALYYNLACAEARLGETEEAFGHLRRALESRPSLKDLAREDTDLDALRGDPRFDDLVGTPTPTPG
jgi:tetratricopeptide (TPR) repeat protein